MNAAMTVRGLAACLSAALCAFASARAQPLPEDATRPARVSAFESGDARLARAIGGAIRQSLPDRGTQTAREALLDCQRGDYPGGGLGLLSLPFGRGTARTDHCFR